jgi:hypothetical protein
MIDRNLLLNYSSMAIRHFGRVSMLLLVRIFSVSSVREVHDRIDSIFTSPIEESGIQLVR